MPKANIKTDDNTIKNLLTRGVADVIQREHLEKRLREGKPLRIKLGIDPSGPDIHLGHAVPLRKLKQFQQAGHHIVIIIGDWTARMGDPTGRNEMRPQLTASQIKKNAATYLKQLFFILDKKQTEIVWQSKWFNKFNLQNVIDLISKFTVSQLLDRDDFRERQKKELEIGYHEPIYSLLQAYDSVMVRADVEIGATEQLFNLLRGRDLQQLIGQKPQDIITLPLLIGLDGKMKMGKSLNNYIGLLDAPNEMYGKIMSIPDSLIMDYFTLCTDVSTAKLGHLQLSSGGQITRNIKMDLAREIVALYHSNKKALKANVEFVHIFQKHELPKIIPTIRMEPWPETLAQALIATHYLAKSMNDARRAIEQGGVKMNGKVEKNPNAVVPKIPGLIISRGKRFFCQLV